ITTPLSKRFLEKGLKVGLGDISRHDESRVTGPHLCFPEILQVLSRDGAHGSLGREAWISIGIILSIEREKGEDIGDLARVGLHLNKLAKASHSNAIDFLHVESGVHDHIWQQLQSGPNRPT